MNDNLLLSIGKVGKNTIAETKVFKGIEYTRTTNYTILENDGVKSIGHYENWYFPPMPSEFKWEEGIVMAEYVENNMRKVYLTIIAFVVVISTIYCLTYGG